MIPISKIRKLRLKDHKFVPLLKKSLRRGRIAGGFTLYCPELFPSGSQLACPSPQTQTSVIRLSGCLCFKRHFESLMMIPPPSNFRGMPVFVPTTDDISLLRS